MLVMLPGLFEQTFLPSAQRRLYMKFGDNWPSGFEKMFVIVIL